MPGVLKAAPLRGTASGAPRAGLWPWEAPPGASAPSQPRHSANRRRPFGVGPVTRSFSPADVSRSRQPLTPGLGSNQEDGVRARALIPRDTSRTACLASSGTPDHGPYTYVLLPHKCPLTFSNHSYQHLRADLSRAGGLLKAMVDSDVHDQAAGAHRRSGPVFDLIAAKLHRPVLRPGTVPRSSLIERLAQGSSSPIVSVVAPGGYGKTTLLAQWAEANGQAFAWVSVDEGDNDPKVLLTYVAEALDAVEPIDERVF